MARAAAAVTPPGVADERPAGRVGPPPPDPARPGPTGTAAVPPAAGGPAVARAAAVVPPREPGGAGPEGAPALRRAEADPTPDPTEAGMLRGARSELRRQMRERRRLRMGILALVSVVLLGAVPLYFGLRTLSHDPVFDTLDALAVPSWAANDTVDNVSGSRWCLQDCRLRERTVESDKAWKETAEVYQQALGRDGWQRWKVSRCPEQPVKGSYTCWRRDELTLDLWVREPTCVPPPVEGEPAPSPAPTPAAEKCTGSLVSVKVRNAIDDERTGPQPSTDPSLTGEDPYPTLTDDPLGELTRSPS